MDILLDTCSFLWLTLEPGKIPAPAMAAFENPANTIYLSSVSTWEIVIKYQLNKLLLPAPPDEFIPAARKDQDITSLPLTEADTFLTAKLPAIHRDPFDRMLICQAINNSMAILTGDQEIHQYPVRFLWR